MTDHQVSPRDGGVIEPAHQSVFSGLVEIDHNIPAENNVKFQAEPDRVHQVEGLEDHIIFDLRRNGELGSALDGGKVPGAPVSGDGIRQFIDALFGSGEGLLRDIGSQYAGIPLGRLCTEKFFDIDGDIIRLLAAGASGAPDRHNAVALVAADQLWQDRLGKEVEVFRLPHEEGIVSGQAVEDRLHIRRVFLLQQRFDKRGEIVVPLLHHQRRQTAGDELTLLGQVNAILLMNKGSQLSKIIIADRSQRHNGFIPFILISLKKAFILNRAGDLGTEGLKAGGNLREINRAGGGRSPE